MAAPGVEGPIAGYGADLLVGRDLVQQMRQNRAIALVAWLADTLARIPDCKITKVDDLLPWHWKR